MKRYSLADKVVFITGAGRGLGGHRHDADEGVVLEHPAGGDAEAALHLFGVHPKLTDQVAEAPHRPAADRARHAPCGSTLVADVLREAQQERMKPTMTDNHFDVLAPFLGRHLRTSVTPTHTEASA